MGLTICRIMPEWGLLFVVLLSRVRVRWTRVLSVLRIFVPEAWGSQLLAKNFKKLKAIQTYHRSSKVCLRQKKSRSDFFWRRPCGRSAQTTVRHRRFFYAKTNREAIFFASGGRPSWRRRTTSRRAAELAGIANAELAGIANDLYLRRRRQKKQQILISN